LEGLNLICFFSRFVPTTKVSFGQSESFVFTPVVSVNAEKLSDTDKATSVQEGVITLYE
jgi:hypothetical protein